jgi:hypothetical protein
MTTTPDLVERILNRSMAYAMPLPLLVEAVNREIGGPGVSPEDLLRSLRSRPMATNRGSALGRWRLGPGPLGHRPETRPTVGIGIRVPAHRKPAVSC